MPTDTSIFITTAGTAMGMSFAIEAIKKSSWFPWITMETHKLNRLLGVIVAGASTFAIHIAWDDSVSVDNVAGVLSISIPTFPVFIHEVWNWFVQWAFQQYSYKVAIKE